MTPIPPHIRKLIDADPFYKGCALYGQYNHTCVGRITMDHSIIYGGTQLQELWAITPVCAAAHGVDGHKGTAELKQLRYWVALNRATVSDLVKISKAVNYVKERDRLNKKLGVYETKVPEPREIIAQMSKESADKKLWYPVPEDLKKKISVCQKFTSEVMGYRATPFEVINTAIRDHYDSLSEQVKNMGDKELFTKLGFEE